MKKHISSDFALNFLCDAKFMVTFVTIISVVGLDLNCLCDLFVYFGIRTLVINDIINEFNRLFVIKWQKLK